MRGFRKKHLLVSLFTTLVILPVLVFVSFAFFNIQVEAAQYCIDNNENRRCFPSFKFRQSEDTKTVDTTYQIKQDPRSNKYWPIQNLGEGRGYRNRQILVSRLTNLPTVELLNRANDLSATNIPVTLRIRGKTREYWHLPDGWINGGGANYTKYTSIPSDLQGRKCSCAPDLVGDAIGRGTGAGQYRYCGFANLQAYSLAVMDTYKTTDPNDCYVETSEWVRFDQNAIQDIYEPRYYRVKKIPAFTLKRITHDDKIADAEFLKKTQEAISLEQRHRSAMDARLNAGAVTPLDYYVFFYRPRFATEDSYETSANPALAENGGYSKCDCDNNFATKECTKGSAIPLNKTACFDKFAKPSKTQGEAEREIQEADTRLAAAKTAFCAAIPAVATAKHDRDVYATAAESQKQKNRYYPYERFDPNSKTQRRENPNFIMLYEGGMTPKTYEAVPAENSSYYSSSAYANECRIGGLFADVKTGVDSGGIYTDYTLTAQGQSTTSVQDVAASAGARAVQTIGGTATNSYYYQTCQTSSGYRTVQAIAKETTIPIAGAECLITLSPRSFDSDVTYYYSVGEVETPPVEIQSFSISASDSDGSTKSVVTDPCRNSAKGGCLEREPISDQNEQDKFRDGRKPSRVNRLKPAQKTLDVSVRGDRSNNVILSWETKYAAGVKLSPPRKHNGIDIAEPKDLLNRRYDDKDVSLSGQTTVHDLSPGPCRKVDGDDNKVTCEPALYSFYLTATNDRAVLATGEDDSGWSVGQRVDLKVKQEELAITSLTADEVKAKKILLYISDDKALVKWKTTGAKHVSLEAELSWGRSLKRQVVDGYGIKEGSIEISGIDVGDTRFTLTAEDYSGNQIRREYHLGIPKEVNFIDVVVHGIGLSNRVLNRSLIEIITGEDCPKDFVYGTICGALSVNNIWRTIGSLVTKGIPLLGDLVGVFLNTLKEPFMAVVGVIMELVDNFVIHKNTPQGVVSTITEFLGGFVKEFIPNFIAGAAEGVFNKLMGDCVGSKMGGWINVGVQALYSGIGGLIQLLGKIPGLDDIGKIGTEMTKPCEAGNSGCSVGICVGQDKGKEIGGTVLVDVISGLIPGSVAVIDGALDTAKKFVEPIATTIFPECKGTVPKEKGGPEKIYTCNNNKCEELAGSPPVCGIGGGKAGEFPNLAACQAKCGKVITIERPTPAQYYKCKDKSKGTCDGPVGASDILGDPITFEYNPAALIACNLTCIQPPVKTYYKCKNRSKGSCDSVPESEVASDFIKNEGEVGRFACNLTCQKTGVGCGCPIHPEFLTPDVIENHPKNRRRAVANALMTAVYVSTRGLSCISRETAYRCATILDQKDMDSAFIKLARDNDWNLSQRKDDIDWSDFNGLYVFAIKAGACIGVITPNLQLCGEEKTEAQCKVITSESDCN